MCYKKGKYMSLKLVRAITQEGIRVFSKKDAYHIGKSIGLKDSTVSKMLDTMVKKGDIEYLGYSLYSFPIEILAGEPLHSFEVAMKIAKKGAISHRSALSYYELTDQIFSTVYVTVPREKGANLSSKKHYKMRGGTYILIRISPKAYWGIKGIFISGEKIWITDLDRTLIDV